MSGFHLRGGGGSIEPGGGGGVQEQGSVDRHHLSVIKNSGAEGAEFFLSKLVNFFPTKYMANDDFSEPLQVLIPKIPFSFFADF